VTKKTTLTPQKVDMIEHALEERKSKRDRRAREDSSGASAQSKADRRTGRDRRAEGDDDDDS
jgi:hypothetical protein